MILKKKNYTRNVLGDINLFFGVPQHDLLERGGESWEDREVRCLQAEGATNTCVSRSYVEYFLSNLSRFGHTLIPPGMYRRDGKCNYKAAQDGSPAIRLCATWWDAQVKQNINKLFRILTLNFS